MEIIKPSEDNQKKLKALLNEIEEFEDDIFFEDDKYPTDKNYLKYIILDILYGNHIYYSDEEVKEYALKTINENKKYVQNNK